MFLGTPPLCWDSTPKFGPRTAPAVPAGTDPWAGLEIPNGFDNSDHRVRMIAQEALLQQQQVGQRSFVVPRGEPPLTAQMNQAMLSGIAPFTPFLVIDEHGQVVSSAFAADCNGDLREALESGWSEALDDYHQRYHDRRNGVAAALASHLPSIYPIPTETIFVESGSGGDTTHLRFLKPYVESQRGVVIAHDIPPQWARHHHEVAPEFAAIALPAYPTFLSPVLRAAPGQVAIELRNVVSALSPGSFSELIALCQEVRPTALFVSQGLQLGDSSGIYRERLRALHTRVVDEFAASIADSAGGDRYRVVAAGLMSETLRSMVMLELVLQNLRAELRDCGAFDGERAFILENSRQLSAEEALRFLAEGFPPYLPLFQARAFDSLSVGPFGVRTDRSASPDGTLRFTVREIHLQFFRDSAPATPGELASNIVCREIGNQFTPPELVDPGITTMRVAGQALHPHDRWSKFSPVQGNGARSDAFEALTTGLIPSLRQHQHPLIVRSRIPNIDGWIADRFRR